MSWKKLTDSILAVILTNLIVFGMNHADIPGDWKILKCPISTCTTLRNCDIIEKCVFWRREMPEFFLFLLWSPQSPHLNPVDWSVWGILQDKVYKTCMTDLDDLKHSIRTEWAKLDHAVIAAPLHQRRRHLKAGGGHFEHCFWFRHCFFSDYYNLSYCRWSYSRTLARK